MDQLLRGDNKIAEATSTTHPGVDSLLRSKTLKETALEAARSQEAAEELATTAAENQHAADSTKSCYFEAHDQALEVAIATETASTADSTSLDEDGG